MTVLGTTINVLHQKLAANFSAVRSWSPAPRSVPRGLDIKRFFAMHAAAILGAVGIWHGAVSAQAANAPSANFEANAVAVSGLSINEPNTLNFSDSSGLLVSVGQRIPATVQFVVPDDVGSSVDFVAAHDAVREIVSGDVLLQEQTLAVLDDDERERLAQFQSMQSGWDFGKGNPLSPLSIESFDRFFAVGGFAPADLCLFMSTDGNLLANYSNPDGSTVELEFVEKGVRVFHDWDDEARFRGTQRFGELRRELIRHYAANEWDQLEAA